MAGFTRPQLRAFSKRTLQIERELEEAGERYESPLLRMQADERASLATRRAKDHSATPAMLLDRWESEAAELGLPVGRDLDGAVCWSERTPEPLSILELFDALVDEETGLCSPAARFGERDVVMQLCARSAGRLTVDEIVEATAEFLASGRVVRLAPRPGREGRRRSGRRPRTASWRTTRLGWSTACR
jgi:hypothetical protein